jgi:hypothetical protein
LRGADPLAPALPRKVQKAIDRESARGLVSAARAQAAEFVTETRIEAVEQATTRAMLGLNRVQQIEAALVGEDPIQAARYGGYVETYYSLSRTALHHMTREF